MVRTENLNLPIAEVIRAEQGNICLRIKKPGANIYDVISLEQFLKQVFREAEAA